MSIKVMTWVWEMKLPPGEKLVLLALADYANDNGECWPSITSIAERSAMTDRGVRKIIRKLEVAGVVETDVGGGRHGCSRYLIKKTRNTEAQNPEHGDTKPGTTFPPEQGSPQNVSAETRNTEAQNPEPRSPEPSRTVKNRQSSSNAHTSDEEASTLKIKDDLLDEVLAAVGITSGKLPTYWMPPASRIHVNRWMTDLGLTRAEIVAQARSSRQRHNEPPNGPKALDRAMRSLAAAKAAGRMKPATCTTGEPARTIPQPHSSIPASGVFIPSELVPDKIPPADLRYADRFGISKEKTDMRTKGVQIETPSA